MAFNRGFTFSVLFFGKLALEFGLEKKLGLLLALGVVVVDDAKVADGESILAWQGLARGVGHGTVVVEDLVSAFAVASCRPSPLLTSFSFAG